MESKESESNTGFQSDQFTFNFLVRSHRATNILNFQSTLPRDATPRCSCSCSLHAYSHHYRSKKRRRAAARNIVSADETFARHERLPDPSGVNEETRHRSSRAERNNFKRRVEGRVSKISRWLSTVSSFLPLLLLSFFFSLFKDTCLADCRRATSSSSVSRSRDTIPAIAIVSAGIKGGISIRNRESAFARAARMNLIDFILQIFLDNVRS